MTIIIKIAHPKTDARNLQLLRPVPVSGNCAILSSQFRYDPSDIRLIC